MNAVSPSVESYFHIHGIFESIAKTIREKSNVYFIELDREDLYSIPLNVWDYIPSFTHERFRAGSDFTIDTVITRKNQPGLVIKFRTINFVLEDLKRYRCVVFDNCEAHIFRHESRWILIIGTKDNDHKTARDLVDKSFEAMRKN